MWYARAEGVSHQAVVVPIRSCGSQRADSLPTQPLPTNCYCDKSHRYKICRLPEGKQSCATQPCFEAEFIKATVPTAWILPASLQEVIAKRLVVQVTWCGEFVQSVRPNQTDTWPPKHMQVWHIQYRETSTFIATGKWRYPINPNPQIFSVQKDTAEPRKMLSKTGRMDGLTNVMRNISRFFHRSISSIMTFLSFPTSVFLSMSSDMFRTSYMHDVFFWLFPFGQIGVVFTKCWQTADLFLSNWCSFSKRLSLLERLYNTILMKDLFSTVSYNSA